MVKGENKVLKSLERPHVVVIVITVVVIRITITPIKFPRVLRFHGVTIHLTAPQY